MRPLREEPIIVTIWLLLPMWGIAFWEGLSSPAVTIIVVVLALIGIDLRIDQLEARLHQQIGIKDEVDQEVE
jgi:hypothetical protein